MLRAAPLALPGALLIEVPTFADERGFFKETYVASKYRALGIEDVFVQDSVSVSRRGVLRGMHADPQMSKLVQVLRGEVFDVIVDARRDSATFGRWDGVYLRAEEHRQIYVPRGFLHGFLSLTEEVVFSYKQSAEYAPQREVGVRYDDPDLDIAWPAGIMPMVSEKDLRNGRFTDCF